MAPYPAERFMGVSSNEGAAMGYYVNELRVIADTREARERGIGWHASTDRYINLAIWFASHVQATANGTSAADANGERSAAVKLEKLGRN